MSRRSTLVTLLATALFVSGAASSSGQGAKPCDRCKDAKSEWSWKANGYALGATADDAHALALSRATDSACKKSATYLDALKLKCKGSCTAGELSDECKPSKKPGCNTGTYEGNKGMWTFNCRKHYEGAESKPSCDKAEAEKNPGYTMCDVSVKAVRVLECTHPDCAEGG